MSFWYKCNRKRAVTELEGPKQVRDEEVTLELRLDKVSRDHVYNSLSIWRGSIRPSKEDAGKYGR